MREVWRGPTDHIGVVARMSQFDYDDTPKGALDREGRVITAVVKIFVHTNPVTVQSGNTYPIQLWFMWSDKLTRWIPLWVAELMQKPRFFPIY